MTKGRLEAFSDGVIAILITIMVLELKVPHGADLAALRPLLPVFLSYVLSFVYLGIYWNNHHHLLHAVQHVDGRILWANLHLLFWLSLVPFVTAWMGETHFAAAAGRGLRRRAALAALAYFDPGARPDRPPRPRTRCWPPPSAATSRARSRSSLYLLAISLAFASRWVACALYVAVAIMWLVPDRRIERALADLRE